MLVLAVGDLHIPDRAIDIPSKFKKLLSPSGKIQQVLCLGNSTGSQETLNFFKSISTDFQIVRGEFDKDLRLPLSLVFQYDKLKIGIINGFSIIPKSDPLSLLTQARMMDVDILISGATHKVEAYTIDGKFFINPGSTTGAFSTNPIDKEELSIIDSLLNERKDLLKESRQRKDVIDNKKESVENDDSNNDNEKENEKEKDEHHDKESNNEQTKEDKIKDSKESTNKQENDITLIKEEEEKTEKESNKDIELDEDELYPDEVEDYLEPVPSFVLLDIQGSVCTLFLYTLIDGEVKVDKITYRKDESK